MEARLTVTAYQITKAKYLEGKGFRDMKKADASYAIVDILKPTPDEIAL